MTTKSINNQKEFMEAMLAGETVVDIKWSKQVSNTDILTWKLVNNTIVSSKPLHHIIPYDYTALSILATTDEVTLIKEVLPMLKTKEELEQIIANASAELKALEEPWTPKGKRWLVSPTKEVDNVEAYNFEPIVAESGLLRDNYGEALKASKDLYTYSRLLAYRDEFDGCTTCLWCLYLIKDNSYDLEQHRYKRLGTVYFTEATARQLLNDIISGKYYL